MRDCDFGHPVLRVRPRVPLPRIRIVAVMQPVPDQAADVKLVVQQPGPAFPVAENGRGSPPAAERPGDALKVQRLGDLSGRQALHRALRQTQQGGRLAVAEAGHADRRQHVLLFLRQGRHRAFDGRQMQARLGGPPAVLAHRLAPGGGQIVQRHRVPAGPADVDPAVARDAEQPDIHAAARLEGSDVAQRLFAALLHEIVRRVGRPRQAAGIGAQPGQEAYNLGPDFVLHPCPVDARLCRLSDRTDGTGVYSLPEKSAGELPCSPKRTPRLYSTAERNRLLGKAVTPGGPAVRMRRRKKGKHEK